MKKMMSILATPFVYAIVTAVVIFQPACTGAWHEPEMPEEMVR
ncbi:cyclic lactone autoinducer peptide [Paenibacillus piri]|uniref:Cyclic lactone autoinducer peptide n=1 Tax=Paenibacillus piri TaxID=2547395 RepID=A0A4V2ZU29_9BACL|nr:cyclic lactone autoinducer peptide [Paenibacillus piri]TDF99424.1 cyclic lactone autoinducer peptide [Paenibacillus piri]